MNGKNRDGAGEVNRSQMTKELLCHSKKFGLYSSSKGKTLNNLEKEITSNFWQITYRCNWKSGMQGDRDQLGPGTLIRKLLIQRKDESYLGWAYDSSHAEK